MILLRQSKGQGLVEVALALPVLLLLLTGSYVCCRSAFLVSAAETASRTEALRAGRGLAGIEQKMSDSMIPGGQSVTISTDGNGNSRLLPSPFPSLAGRTTATVEFRKTWEEAGGFADFPALRTARIAEASIDCWEKRTASGRKIRTFVSGFVATGILR